MTQQARAPSQPYGSARDLPSFRELDEMLQGAKLVTALVARQHRAKLELLQSDLDKMVETVDRFYEMVGERNWIFHDLLPLDATADLLNASSGPEQVEQGLVRMYRDPDLVKYWLLKLCNQPLLRPRAHQIRRAYDHLLAEQFDSSVLQLIAVMDGYVSDLDPGNRKGLHARNPDDVIAWDSVVGHHLGLSHALKTFLRPIKRRIDEPVTEVYRHGIVHGMVVSFDSPVVACKAWSMLFALNDWAASLEKAAVPVEPRSTLRDIGATLARQARYNRAQRDFVGSSYEVNTVGFDDLEVVGAARTFLDAWEKGRWAIVASFMPVPLMKHDTEGHAAKFAKDCFQRFDIARFELVECCVSQPSTADLVANVTCNGTSSTIRFRMVYWADAERIGLPTDGGGGWRLAVGTPSTFFEKPVV